MRPIDADDLINTKPEFRNERVVRNTKYQTTKDRIYAKAWNACNSYWLNIIDNAQTVEPFEPDYVGAGRLEAGQRGYEEGYRNGIAIGKTLNPKIKQGEWIMDNEHTKNPLLWYKCNLCGVYHSPTNFCPNCGAKMKGEEE